MEVNSYKEIIEALGRHLSDTDEPASYDVIQEILSQEHDPIEMIAEALDSYRQKQYAPPISLEKAKGILNYWKAKGHGMSCSGLTECALARSVLEFYGEKA